MITISAFARLTGLSTKALRLYHERGLLVPAHVDPHTGYRTYDLGQVEDAVRISVLRRAGMSMDRVQELATDPDRADQLVAEHRDQLRRRRESEDRALDGAQGVLSAGAVPLVERVMEMQPYVAVSVPLPGDVPADDEVDRAGQELREALDRAGAAPTGPFWTTIAVEDGATAVVLHWPLASPADDGMRLGTGVRRGALPARTEAVVEIAMPATPGDEAVQLALAAVLSDGGDPRTLRQTTCADGTRLEFAITVAVGS